MPKEAPCSERGNNTTIVHLWLHISNIPVSSSLAYSPLQWMSQKCVLIAQLAENETGNHVRRWRIVVQPHNSFELC